MNFEKAGDGVDEYVAHTIAFSGDNRYLKGTVNINVDPEFQGENSIPGGVTNCYGNSIEAQILDPKTNIIIDTAAVIVPENATLNILGETAMIMGNLVVKGVMNIGAPAATE